MTTNKSESWGETVRTGMIANHRMTLSQIQSQLQSERNAHKETLSALEQSRLCEGKEYRLPKAKEAHAEKSDLVEIIFSDVLVHASNINFIIDRCHIEIE
jgi:hypothetical protein